MEPPKTDLYPEGGEKVDTKKKILKTARYLFAKYGFAGTSIREIARASNVNVAAVNYHFQNKSNLYWEIISKSYDEAVRFCEDYFEASGSTEEFAVKVFNRFLKEGEMVRNTIKLLLTESKDEGQISTKKLNKMTGPPGGKFFGEFIQREVQYELSEEAVQWAVKTIFGVIIHWAMLCHTSGMEERQKLDPLLSTSQLEKNLKWTVRSVIKYLKENAQEFSQ